ncbi:M23 family metallopeptidase [Curtobacterium sp. NPDC087080]|uniref:M23 family metallopeptidase n=1 Tax=Curtobacterium sp. NPDC087080 TaxID=3363965 RepID=UPI00380CEE7B
MAAAASVSEIFRSVPAFAAPSFVFPFTQAWGVSSPYGMRTHPITGEYKMHYGIDYKAGSGVPIHACAGGKVAFAGANSGWGNQVRIDHGGGYVTSYNHMTAGSITVKTGQTVELGTLLGTVGATGDVTGAHLHLEYLVNGTNQDPASVISASRLNPGKPAPTPSNPSTGDDDDMFKLIKANETGRVWIIGPVGKVHVSNPSHASLLERFQKSDDLLTVEIDICKNYIRQVWPAAA